jgi:hypothetical protein
MKKTNNLDVWMISQVSVFLGQSIDTQMGGVIEWYLNNGSQVHIDFNDKYIAFVDWVGDDKTYYSIVGIASMAEFTTHDCYTEK